MNKRYMKQLTFGLAALMMLAVPASSMADDSVVEIRREDVAQMVLDYNPTVKGLELDYIAASQDYLDYKDSMEDYEEVYDQLSTYKSLHTRYNNQSDHYQTWLGLSLALENDPDNATYELAIENMTNGDETVTDPDTLEETEVDDGNGMTNAEELALAEEIIDGGMSVSTYSSYLVLAGTFEAFGFDSPNISNQDEYDTFIYPIYVVPKIYQRVAKMTGIGLDQAESGIASGAESLYDATLMLEGYQALTDLSYEMAVDSLVAAEKKYELGQISEIAYKQAVNDARIAELERDVMDRDVENLHMSLNVMLGQAVDTPLALVSEVGAMETLEDVETYIASGQNQRAELRYNAVNEWYYEEELEYIDEYLGDNKIEYYRADNSLEDLKIERAYELKHIEADVRQAYMAVLQSEEKLAIEKLEMEDALRQQSDMQLNVELGYVTETAAKGIDVMVTSATEDYYKAYRDYLTAYNNLELASTIGK